MVSTADDQNPLKGLIFLAKRNGECYFREETSIYFINKEYSPDKEHGPFWGMVPGRIGDPKAGFDERFNGIGWKYSDDRDYIVYSSMDFDSNGVDISGNNYNDWPIRYVNGSSQYVAEVSDRPKYKPAFVSDEDFFTVYKDTDTRAYRDFQKATPLGIEIQQYVYTWGSKGLQDIVVFRYDLINKGNAALDSCYFFWAPGIEYLVQAIPGPQLIYIPHTTNIIQNRNLVYQKPGPLIPLLQGNATYNWQGTPFPPTLGSSVLFSPAGYDGDAGGMKDGGAVGRFTYQYETGRGLVDIFSDTISSETIFYNRLLQNKPVDQNELTNDEPFEAPIILSTPFRLLPGDTARFVSTIMFCDDSVHLFLMDDFVKRMYRLGFMRPTPPSSPVVTAKPLNRGIYLTWDRSAEGSIDPVIPDSLGKAFYGYRVYRADKKEGPFKLLSETSGDTLAHEFYDQGKDLAGGLKNNVTYYYKVVSFDQGAPLLHIDPMESSGAPVAIVPSVGPTNLTVPNTQGSQTSGTLGGVTSLSLIPINPTSYAAFFSGASLNVTLNATTDGTKYYLPLTIHDSLSGRTQNEAIDPELFVHGTNASKGIKKGSAIINDIFKLGGANLEVDYQFEQLADSFRVNASIESAGGADVPIVINDSLHYTGIYQYDPYSSAPKSLSLRFTTAGIDTVSQAFSRYMPFINVELYDNATGQKIDSGYSFTTYGIRIGASQTYSGKPNRYYLSGTLANGEKWDFLHTLSTYNTRIGFDFGDHGVGSTNPGTTFLWASTHRTGTKDFQPGDQVTLQWNGGVNATFPENAEVVLHGTSGTSLRVTSAMMDQIRIVPNPYLARQEAERGERQLYFNYLPDQCTIRIYTIALDLVKTINHQGGSREVWNLQTEGGQIVASQMFFAYIESANGAKTIKKFSLIVGK
ncbi:MAG TPA: hypothetical protein VMM58_09900 [Bacteroidota bacterium]|nr:hypothetical protein [Bacteroidota bacterium]